MPRYKVKAPDGSTYTVNAPDGATEQDAIAYVQNQLSQKPVQKAQGIATPQPQPQDNSGLLSRIGGALAASTGLDQVGPAIGGIVRNPGELGKSSMDTARNVLQGASLGWNDEASAAIGALPGLFTGDYKKRYAELVGGERAAQRQYETAHPVAALAGQIGGGLLTGGAGTAQATTALGKVANGAVLGSLYGGVSGAGMADGGLDNTLAGLKSGAVTGGILGAAAPAVSSLLSNPSATARGVAAKAISPLLPEASPGAIDMARRARGLGIDMNASQVLDSRPLKFLDSVTAATPLSGGTKKIAKQNSQWIRAVSHTIGEDTDSITPDVYDAARKRIGTMYDDLAKRNNLPLTPGFTQKIASLVDEAGAVDDGIAKTVRNLADRLVSKSVNGYVPGSVYKSVDSEVGRALKAGGEKSVYIGELRDIMRQHFSNSVRPEDVSKMAEANSQYRALKTIQDLVAKDTGDGYISPAALLGRVNATKSGKSASASGRGGDLLTLAKIGQRMKDAAQGSPTQERLMAQAIANPVHTIGSTAGVLGAGVGAGALLGGPLIGGAGGLLSARALQSLLKSPELLDAVLKNPQTSPLARKQLTDALARSGGLLGGIYASPSVSQNGN